VDFNWFAAEYFEAIYGFGAFGFFGADHAIAQYYLE
jgi:hypothetical protein